MTIARHSRSAFTLSQLIVLLALVALFLGFLLSVVSRVRKAAEKSQSENNLKQIVLGTINHADQNKSRLPASCDANHFSAFAHILPQLDNDPLFKSIDFTKSIDDKANAEARKTTLKYFLS